METIWYTLLGIPLVAFLLPDLPPPPAETIQLPTVPPVPVAAPPVSHADQVTRDSILDAPTPFGDLDDMFSAAAVPTDYLPVAATDGGVGTSLLHCHS